MTDTLILIAVLVHCLVISIVFHEVAHGYAAKLLGDNTAIERGRFPTLSSAGSAHMAVASDSTHASAALRDAWAARTHKAVARSS